MPATEQVMKYVARGLSEARGSVRGLHHGTVEGWREAIINWFGEVYSYKGTNSQFYNTLLNRVDHTWKDWINSELDKDRLLRFNLDVISN